MMDFDNRRLSDVETISRTSDWPRVDRYIMRFADMSLGAGFTERLHVQEAGEVCIFSDHPISVSVNSATAFSRPARMHHFRGRITGLWARAETGVEDFGRIVIYAGRPNLGPFWQRELPPHIQPMAEYGGSTGFTFPSGGTTSNPSGTIVVPEPSGIYLEALYLHGFSMQRTVGIITGCRIEEMDSGLARDIYRTTFDAPGGVVNQTFPVPLRIASSYRWVAVGSNEAVNSTVIVNALTTPV